MTYYMPNRRNINRFLEELRERIRFSVDNDILDYLSLTSLMAAHLRGDTIADGSIGALQACWTYLAAWFKMAEERPGQRVYIRISSRALPGNIASVLIPERERTLSFFDVEGPGRVEFTLPQIDLGRQEGNAPVQEASDVVLTPLTGWAQGYAEVRPAAHLLEGQPNSVATYAVRTVPISNGESDPLTFFDENWQIQSIHTTGSNGHPSGAELIAEARTKYRDAFRSRMGMGMKIDFAEFERKRAEHREKTKANFEAFVRNRETDEDQHINKLPFVPHGLASSRRWGIEVESGGSRGVACPENWDVKGDGSLRSAYDGYVEVQDFEPFDEEVTERVHWENCDNYARHNPSTEILDTTLDAYIRVPREDYIDPRSCENCGNVTRTVHREPQTIRHSARSGDCREFVSPILTSMHSNGLEALTTALSQNPQNDSAGVHVHVEASDLTKQQIAIMVYGYDILEPILEASYRRNRRDFCERRDATEVLAAARKARTEGVTGNEGGRYRTLNTHSLSNHGTLEFRAMGPVYEYDYLVRWAMLCRELVNSVANGAQTKDFAKIKNWDDLTAFLAKFGKEYIRAAVYEMSGEVGEAAKLEKAGEPVTTEALDTDLRNMLAGTYEIAEAFRGMARTISAVGATINTANLAMVGAMSEI